MTIFLLFVMGILGLIYFLLMSRIGHHLTKIEECLKEIDVQLEEILELLKKREQLIEALIRELEESNVRDTPGDRRDGGA